jgi:hypothetical protein
MTSTHQEQLEALILRLRDIVDNAHEPAITLAAIDRLLEVLEHMEDFKDETVRRNQGREG